MEEKKKFRVTFVLEANDAAQALNMIQIPEYVNASYIEAFRYVEQQQVILVPKGSEVIN